MDYQMFDSKSFSNGDCKIKIKNEINGDVKLIIAFLQNLHDVQILGAPMVA